MAAGSSQEPLGLFTETTWSAVYFEKELPVSPPNSHFRHPKPGPNPSPQLPDPRRLFWCCLLSISLTVCYLAWRFYLEPQYIRHLQKKLDEHVAQQEQLAQESVPPNYIPNPSILPLLLPQGPAGN